jgi:hypothetical protein
MTRRILLYVVFLLVLVFVVTPIAFVGVDLLFWYPHYKSLQETNKPRADDVWEPELLPAATIRKLGSVYNVQESWFGNFPKDKRPGVIRIGAFGDSFTHGDEVDRKSDFPAQLAMLMKEAGAADVEVLNFGNSWYGFGQTYMMWEEVGRAYNLDYILLGPMSFFADRDTRFNHTGGLNPYYLHSRFVLDGDGIRRVDVQGETHSERFGRYHGFIPRWDYLRYDRNDPPFLAALLPNGRTLENPFYYRSETERAEATEIYRRLLQKMKMSRVPTILGIYFWFNDVWQATSRLGDEQFCITEFDRPTRFPYLAPGSHNSPSGNLFLAHQYLSALLGRPIEAPLMTTSDLDQVELVSSGESELSSYDAARIVIGSVEAGRFVALGGADGGSEDFLKAGGFNALLAVKAPAHSMLDGLIVALPTMDPSAPITFRFRSTSGEYVLPVTGRRISNQLRSVDLPGIGSADEPDVVDQKQLAGLFQRALPAGNLEVLVGNEVVLEGSNANEGDNIRLGPTKGGRAYIVRGSPNGIPDANEVGGSGTVDLELVRGPNVTRIPLARWVVAARPVSASLMCPTFRPQIASKTGLAGFRTAPGLVNVAITASSDAYDGPPQMRVWLDDQFVGDFLVKALHSRDAWENFSLHVPSNGEPKALTIEFLNDDWNSVTLEDRNLWIKEVDLGARVLKPEEGTFVDAATGDEKPGESILAVKGKLVFDLQ